MMRRSGPAQDEVRHLVGVRDGVLQYSMSVQRFKGICRTHLLRKESAKTPTCNDCFLVPAEVLPERLDVVHQLLERVRRRERAVPVTAEVESKDPIAIGQRLICLEVRAVIACRGISVNCGCLQCM